MAEEAAYGGCVSGDPEEGLVRELLCHRRGASSVLFPGEEEHWCPSFLPPEAPSEAAPTSYSGPTIGDVEAALAMTCSGAESGSHVCRRATIALPERGFSKMEGKFSLRIKCCSNGMADDGYKWRKYGQKFIKNNPYPRSYYRCTNPRCSAKKQVERSADDPETLVVTYDGLHLHYAFPHFPLSGPREIAAAAPAVKKAKLETDRASAPQASTRRAAPRAPAGAGTFRRAGGEDADAEVCRTLARREALTAQSSPVEPPAERQPAELPQGLLEDVVPELVRKPCSNIDHAAPSDPSLSSLPSPPPPSSSPSSQFSWSHVSSFFDDLGILSMPSSPASTSSSSGTFPWPHAFSLFDFGALPGTV